jgi:hypothetical protein
MKLCGVIFAVATFGFPLSAKAVIDKCPFVIGVAANGDLYDLNAMNMPALRRSPKVLEQYLQGGCYNDANPSPVTSVTLELAPHAPTAKIDFVYAIFARNGWSKDKVISLVWKNAPDRPATRSRD